MKLSVVSVCYNNLEGLKKTLQSLEIQTCQTFELLVLDGGSTDGTPEFLSQQDQSIDYWISEPDRGIYHAMNKGIQAATGEYILFLNSGDVLADAQVMEQVLPALTGEDLIYGNAYYERPDRRYPYPMPGKLSLGTLLKEPICHQSAFYRRAFLLRFGMYDEENRIASDHIFNLKAFIQESPTQKHLPLYISVFDKTGISCTHPEVGQKEIEHFLDRHLSPELRRMALEYDQLKNFAESPWGRYGQKLRNFYNKLQ